MLWVLQMGKKETERICELVWNGVPLKIRCFIKSSDNHTFVGQPTYSCGSSLGMYINGYSTVGIVPACTAQHPMVRFQVRGLPSPEAENKGGSTVCAPPKGQQLAGGQPSFGCSLWIFWSYSKQTHEYTWSHMIKCLLLQASSSYLIWAWSGLKSTTNQRFSNIQQHH